MQQVKPCFRCNERRATHPVIIQPDLAADQVRLLVCEVCAREYRDLLASFFEPAVRRERAERVAVEQRFAAEAERQRALIPQDDGYLTDAQAAKHRAAALWAAQAIATLKGEPLPTEVPFEPLTRQEAADFMADVRAQCAALPDEEEWGRE